AVLASEARTSPATWTVPLPMPLKLLPRRSMASGQLPACQSGVALAAILGVAIASLAPAMTFAGTAKRSELARLNGTGARGAAETAGSPLQQVGESENFRVLSSGAEPVDPGVLKQCEQLRAQLYRTWTNAEPQHAWRPRCEI